MNEIFLTADTHFYHNNILRLCNRPFSSIEEMNEKFVENWNSVVSRSDRVYFLGDFGWSTAINLDKLFSSLNGNKFLIKGNHDKKEVKKLKWGWIKDVYELNLGNRKTVWLSHFPHSSWDKSFHGAYHAAGHVHNTRNCWYYKNSCDVGVDYWNYTPVNVEDFITHIENINRLTNGNNFMWKGYPYQEIFDIFYIDQIQNCLDTYN